MTATLLSWRDGATKEAITDFVPVSGRIAKFCFLSRRSSLPIRGL